MAKCFHGLERNCQWCAVIKAQALRQIGFPVARKTFISGVIETLKNWILFWVPKGGLSWEEMKIQEAQQVAVNDGLLTLKEIEDNELVARQTLE